MAWGRRRSWFGHFKNQKSTSLGNRGGILGRQETCPAKGQMRWGLERQFGGAEGWRMNLGSHLQTPGERLGFVVEWGSPQGPEERGQMRAAPCGPGGMGRAGRCHIHARLPAQPASCRHSCAPTCPSALCPINLVKPVEGLGNGRVGQGWDGAGTPLPSS